jgi:GT2 family glycosyltransferase
MGREAGEAEEVVIAVGLIGDIRNQDQQNSCYHARKGRSSAGDTAKTFPVKLATPSQSLQVDSMPVLSTAQPSFHGRFPPEQWFALGYWRQCDTVCGCGLAIRTELWQQLGGFDPLYCPTYCEDTDLCLRVRAAAPGAVAAQR